MKLNTQYQALPSMNEQSVKRDKTLEKIASALELTMADSASRTISSALRDQVSTMTQGLMNGTDGISMMQIADGALTSLNDQAQTLSDLSVRYNSASLNDSQKQTLQGAFSRTVESMEQTVATTSFNGQSLFGSDLSISLGSHSINASVANVSPSQLNIANQDGIQAYRDSLSQASSDVSSTTNGLISASNTLLEQITNTSAAKSQITDTDMSKAISDFQSSNRLLDASALASKHQTQYLRESIGRLLG